MTNKILVTGGAGFIGSFLVDELVEKGHEVTILDPLVAQVHPNGIPDYINKKATLVQGECGDKKLIAQLAQDHEIIFHQGALVGVGQSMYEIEKYVQGNSLQTAAMLDVLANNDHNVKKVVVASSMSSYGEGACVDSSGNRLRPALRSEKQMASGKWELLDEQGNELTPVGMVEQDKQIATSVYAITKKDQEELVMNVCETYGICATALRYFNVYGPRQSLSNPYTGVAAIFMSRIKNDHQPRIFEDGLQSRDFVSVHDIVQANMLSMQKAADNEVFNVGTGLQTSILQVANTLSELFGKESKPEITKQFRKGDIRHCFADISKIKSKLEYEPKYSFEQGMKELLEWADAAESVDMVDKATDELKKKGLLS